ncbi:MAG: conserved phage C-terminal domain-containing protein [candidate division NC10 bacterium]|nr:conserved phage C-terminal domain-containing protein [candidate division NC10 bacterium]
MSWTRKINTRIWMDERFRRLSSTAKLVWIYILTGPDTTPIGAYRFSAANAIDDLKLSRKTFQRAFKEILQQGLLPDYSDPPRIVFLRNWLRYQQPENPNVLKSWRTYFDQLPEVPLKREVFRTLRLFAEGKSEGFAKAFEEAFGEGFNKAHGFPEERLPEKAEAEAEAEAENPPSPLAPRAASASEVPSVPSPGKTGKTHRIRTAEPGDGWRSQALVVLRFFNQLTGRNFKEQADGNLTPICSRLREGYTVEDTMLVIRHKADQWDRDSKMREYLRPETLFAAKHFDGYLQVAKEWQTAGCPSFSIQDAKQRGDARPSSRVKPPPGKYRRFTAEGGEP